MAGGSEAVVVRWVKGLERVTTVVGAVGAAIILPLVLAMVFEVVSRRLLGAPTAWAYEVSYMMMGTIFMCGMAYAMRRREHVTVDLFYQRMTARQQALVDLVGYGLLLVVTLWLVQGTLDFAIKAFERGQLSGQSAWNPPVWPFRAVFVLGFAVLALQTVLELVKALLTLRYGRRPAGLTPAAYEL